MPISIKAMQLGTIIDIFRYIIMVYLIKEV